MRWTILGTAIAFAGANLVSADQSAFIKSSDFDKGVWGEFVGEQYKTSEIAGVKPNFIPHHGNCRGDGLHVMMTLRGYAVPNPGPTILDDQGALVWAAPQYVQPYNMAVQKYKGEQYLTFWVGDDGVRGHGAGEYYMLNSSYHEVYRVRGGNNHVGDLHEFLITDEDTALITVYEIAQADLSSVGGPAEGWIWEGIFQEVNIETNEVLFEWKASDHLGFDQSYWGPGVLGGNTDDAWDWFHINSVEKDPKGNYIISSRWLHSVTYINGTSGEIIWILGGKSNMFKDLSDGQATEFASQHHARWRDDYTAITLFDNSRPGPDYPSTGIWLDIDVDEMTVRLRTKYTSKNRIISESQGSFQVLPNGNVLLGYGFNAQFTEFSQDGTVLCSVHYGSASAFGRGGVQSYRTGKFPWVGKPDTPPEINQIDGDIFMSWMGATEVAKWRIEQADAANATEHQYSTVKTVSKKGFETTTDNRGASESFVRAVALDKHGNVLGKTRTVERGEMKPIDPQKVYVIPTITIVVLVITGGTALAVIVLAGLYIRRRWLRYRAYERPAATAEEDEEAAEVNNAKEFVLEDSEDEREDGEEEEDDDDDDDNDKAAARDEEKDNMLPRDGKDEEDRT